jgi:uncharacterized protein YqhQ
MAVRVRDAPVGGQAVLEGVMMRGVRTWSVAVRAPTDEQLARGEREIPAGAISVQTFPFSSALRRHRVLRLPLLRGIVALGGSMAIGMRALNIAANVQISGVAEQGAEAQSSDGGEQAQRRDAVTGVAWAGALIVSFVFAIGLFFVAPVGLVSLIKSQLHSSTLFWLIEGVVRTVIFLAYLVLLSRLRELRRVFEYHGAEHKTIACHEAGQELTPENAARFSRLHPRCGTSFLLIVMIVAIFVFAPIGLPAWYWLLATRILGVPVIAGISFEIIKLAARHRDRAWVRAVMAPGLALQRLTTREPDHAELAVAIAALRSVLAVESGDRQSPSDLIGLEVVA